MSGYLSQIRKDPDAALARLVLREAATLAPPALCAAASRRLKEGAPKVESVLGKRTAEQGTPVDLMRAAGMEPDRWQAEFLGSDAPRTLLLCSRQSGKSTVTAALALHEALYSPGSLVLMLAPAQRQSQELFRKVMDFYRALGRPEPSNHETSQLIEFPNGSRILSLPGKEQTVRGYSGVRLLAVDEAARVPDELYFAVRPMLAVSGGRIVAMSTPFGKRGWFHSEWTGDREWRRFEVKAADCPRIAPEFLAEERAALGDWWYSQEYECNFVDAIDSVFDYASVMAAVSDDVQPFFANNPPAPFEEAEPFWRDR